MTHSGWAVLTRGLASEMTDPVGDESDDQLDDASFLSL